MTTGLFAGLLVGWWLDRRMDSAPLFLLIGLGLGVAVGLWEVGRVALGAGRRKNDRQGGDRD